MFFFLFDQLVLNLVTMLVACVCDYSDSTGCNNFPEMSADVACCDDDVGFELIAADQICEPSDNCSLLNSVTLSDSQASSSNSSSEVTSCSYYASVELLPEQIRWMYRDSVRHKKWIPFIGYDSLRLECKYRETCASSAAALSTSSRVIADECVVVKGGLYEVDVVQMKCFPIYWSSKGILK